METRSFKKSKINLFQWKITWRWIGLFKKHVYQSKQLPAETSQQYNKNRTREKSSDQQDVTTNATKANKYNLFYHTLANVAITLYDKWIDNYINI